MLPRRLVFGDENARLDTNLYKCSVPLPSQAEHQPILRGRWGVGKTATFLLRHRKLSSKLKDINKKYEYIWYLDEGGLEAEALFFLYDHYKSQPTLFKRQLEKLWLAEILRTHARILSVLYSYYGKPQGDHWKIIRANEVGDRYGKSVWTKIADSLNAGSDIGKVISSVINSISSTFSDHFQDAVNLCLSDIVDDEIYPVVVVEPIETPKSIFEDEDVRLSQIILVSLLDLFISKLSFAPARGQFMCVEMSIPWHRTVREYVREPQKMAQYSGRFFWPRTRLKQFMNKRISNEFSSVRRTIPQRSDKDEWNILFDSIVRNGRCSCNEDSFSYFLRHTHHRTRDLMRLARTVMHTEVDLRRTKQPEFTVDDLLKGGPNIYVTQEAIRSGVEEALKETSEDRLSEASRRFHDIREIIDCLRGIKMPFTDDDIAKRIGSLDIEVETAVEILWECGIVGFKITPAPNTDVSSFAKLIGEEGVSRSQTFQGNTQIQYYLFEYNSEMSCRQIKRTINNGIAKLQYVIHPVFIENMGVITPTGYPVGV